MKHFSLATHYLGDVGQAEVDAISDAYDEIMGLVQAHPEVPEDLKAQAIQEFADFNVWAGGSVGTQADHARDEWEEKSETLLHFVRIATGTTVKVPKKPAEASPLGMIMLVGSVVVAGAIFVSVVK